MDVLAGTAYRTICSMGRGGMGELLLAEHVALGKRVAVEVLDRRVPRAPAALVARARMVRHPAVAEMLDVGRTADDRVFLVLERLRGRTLAQELAARGPLPPLEAIDRIRQALEGIAAAHDAGIVHGSIGLESLFLCDPRPGEPRATVKVLDLGLAELLGPGRLDARTDVFGAGLALYELIAGRGSFERFGASFRVGATCEPPPPSVLRASARRHHDRAIPASLDALVLQAIARDPQRRFPRVEAFSEALARVASAIQDDDEADAAPTVMFAALPRAPGLPLAVPAPIVDTRATVRLSEDMMLHAARIPRTGSPPATACEAPVTTRESPWAKRHAAGRRHAGSALPLELRTVVAAGLAIVLAALAVIAAYRLAGSSARPSGALQAYALTRSAPARP